MYVSTWDACCVWLDQMSVLSTEIPFHLVDAEVLVDEEVILWVERCILWRWSSRRCQVAAGWPLPQLCFGPGEHALDEYFLRRAHITHVACFLGAGSVIRSSSSSFRAVMGGRFRGIRYQSWRINHTARFGLVSLILRVGSIPWKLVGSPSCTASQVRTDLLCCLHVSTIAARFRC